MAHTTGRVLAHPPLEMPELCDGKLSCTVHRGRKLPEVSLDINNRLLHVELISLGSYTSTVVEPMNAFRVALIKGSIKVILVHNHPGGNLDPSADDKEVTDRLIQVGRILNVPVFDHLIISTAHFYSFRSSGLLVEIEQSLKWVPPYQLVAKIKAEEKMIREEAVRVAEMKGIQAGRNEGIMDGLREGLVIGKDEGKNERNVEIAKNSLKEGLSIELIIKLTGLAAAEIGDL